MIDRGKDKRVGGVVRGVVVYASAYVAVIRSYHCRVMLVPLPYNRDGRSMA